MIESCCDNNNEKQKGENDEAENLEGFLHGEAAGKRQAMPGTVRWPGKLNLA